MLPLAMAKIQRSSLRAEALRELRRQILVGELAGGSVLRETQLAEQLGISRTPLREALLALERDGFLARAPGRGFAVRELDVEDVRELYPLRALLESRALEESGLPDAATLEALGRLNDELGHAAPGPEWLELDLRWHDLLLAGCQNQHLLRLIENLRQHTRRYEFAYFAAARNLTASVRQHREILDQLAAGQLEEACRRLQDNMVVGQEPILGWLRGRS